MIQDAMRKHRRIFLAVLLVLLIGPFVLWGGYSGMSSAPIERQVEAVATVGDRPVPAELFRSYLMSQRQQRSQFGQAPTPESMLQDGTAMQILEQLVSRVMLEEAAEKGEYIFDQDYLIEKLKDRPEFKDENGQFDPKVWNQIVKQDINWKQLYETERQNIAFAMVVKRASASARVLEADLKKQFEENNTSIELKYLAVAPAIEPTEEEIKETYDQNPDNYSLPEQRRAEVVALSLVPPKPALADELVQRARNGEDFAALVAANSQSPSKDSGGDLGWLSDGPILRPHQKPVFALQKGQISDPIDGPNGYYIYKVEDERTDPVSNLREVKVTELHLTATLDEAAYTAVKDKAAQIQAKAKETGDLRAAATEAGLEVITTGLFAFDSLNIENIPDADARFLRSRLSATELNAIADPFEAQRNLYVAKVIELVPAVPQAFELVRDKVKEDTIARAAAAPEYMQKCTELATKIATTAKSLDEAVSQYPELGATVQTVPAFTLKTYDFSKGPMWNPRDVFALVSKKEPGAMVGPINDFTGKVYFAELVSKTPPTDEAWEKDWPAEEKTLREQALSQQEMRRLEDYVAYLREDFMNKGLYNVDNAAFVRALGLGGEQEEGQPAEAGMATDAAAPAVEGEVTVVDGAAAPAESAPVEIAPIEAAPAEPAATAPPAETAAPAAQ